jgi:transposase
VKLNSFHGPAGMVFRIDWNDFHRPERGALDIKQGDLILFYAGGSDLPARRLSMRKIQEVLRLRSELGFGYRQIARSCLIGVGTVHEYLKRAEAAGLKWPLPDGMNETKLNELLFGRREASASGRTAPDFAAVHEQLRAHKLVTLQLLWEEYRQAQPDGYGYSRFCELYHRYRRRLDPVLRQEHVPGEKMFVDWAGDSLPIHNPSSGEIQPVSLFVAVLGFSSYTYAEADHDEQMEAWLGAHMRALEYYGGAPRLVVPDNTKTGVAKACRYDPDLNPTYQDMALHYGMGVVPARPYRPRDKAKVESGVLLAERWILAALRHRQFFSLAEANAAIRELLERLNHRPFRQREGSRASLFAQVERAALRPLPAERFDLSQWSRAKVNIDYHIAFDTNFYSVPYTLIGEVVDVRSTPTTVEIFHRGDRVASHLRERGHGKAVTTAGHRPKSHQAHLEWTPSRMVSWAGTIGPHTAQLFERILADKPHPEMGYRSCLGIIRLSHQYSPERVEAAAERALLTGACRYKSVKSMLEKSLDREPLANRESAPAAPPVDHENVRGAEYFQ